MLQLIITELHPDEHPEPCQVPECQNLADYLASAQTDGPYRQAKVCHQDFPAIMRRLTDVGMAHLECRVIPELVPGE